ncbi:hypothetical protein GUJ93_ZPchr0002g25910 [Zizania palustris]|uniref:Protein kinase domain-containing protein n=1 Tax=Zizania palustris TaxID=103762 RepID=A0A8J5RG65_ZIZPA|nr:hypothetical protein GUJ93_ZPchr0002g25910 [Zizania palustris]
MGAIREWQRGAVIGRGATATVSIATDRRTGQVFAVKSVDVAHAGALRRERSMLCALSSPFVVSCAGAEVSAAADGRGGTRYELFLEYAVGGSLADEIKRCGGRCEEPLIRSRVGNVLRGLAYVHGAGIAHCDVKGRNVLIGDDGRAMLADFGCARLTGEDGIAGGRTIRGTPMFLAPEAARGKAQGTEADIWALGCMVIEMATGGAPWPRFADPVAALHHIAHSGDVPEPPAWFSSEGKDFLSRCLIRDPTKRWTAEQLIEHPFVAYAAPNSCSMASQIGERVSPTSILDQCLWEDSSSNSDTATVAPPPADRLRALSAGAPAAPDWTWSVDDWIPVCGGLTDDDPFITPSPQPDPLSCTIIHSAELAPAPALISPGGGEEIAGAVHRGHGGTSSPRSSCVSRNQEATAGYSNLTLRVTTELLPLTGGVQGERSRDQVR